MVIWSPLRMTLLVHIGSNEKVLVNQYKMKISFVILQNATINNATNHTVH